MSGFLYTTNMIRQIYDTFYMAIAHALSMCALPVAHYLGFLFNLNFYFFAMIYLIFDLKLSTLINYIFMNGK